MSKHSRLLSDIEHDLNRIAVRLHALEDHFEDDGIIARLAKLVHQLTEKIEALEQARQVGDADHAQ